MLLVRHCQKRRLDSEFYKKGHDRVNNSSSLSAREEFSEIRYLTEDEQLDFRMSTPSTFRPPPPKNSTITETFDEPSISNDETSDNDNEGESAEGEKKKKIKEAKKEKKEKSENGKSVTKSKKSKTQKKVSRDYPDNEGLLEDEEEEDW